MKFATPAISLTAFFFFFFKMFILAFNVSKTRKELITDNAGNKKNSLKVSLELLLNFDTFVPYTYLVISCEH